jgi:hypothetical protein
MERNQCFEVGEGDGLKNVVLVQPFHVADSPRRLH